MQLLRFMDLGAASSSRRRLNALLKDVQSGSELPGGFCIPCYEVGPYDHLGTEVATKSVRVAPLCPMVVTVVMLLDVCPLWLDPCS